MSAILYINCVQRIPEIAIILEGRPHTRMELQRHPEDVRGVRLFTGIRELLAQSGVAPGDLTAVATGTGPGPMTGTRVGIAAGKGLAAAWSLPLIGLPQWFAYADPQQPGPQRIAFPLGRIGTAVATVTVESTGWRLDAPEVRSDFPATDQAPSTETMACAAAAARPDDPQSILPMYMREPDVLPQTDALGRPLRTAAG